MHGRTMCNFLLAFVRKDIFFFFCWRFETGDAQKQFTVQILRTKQKSLPISLEPGTQSNCGSTPRPIYPIGCANKDLMLYYYSQFWRLQKYKNLPIEWANSQAILEVSSYTSKVSRTLLKKPQILICAAQSLGSVFLSISPNHHCTDASTPKSIY